MTKITMIFHLPPALRDALLAAVRAMLRTLPFAITVEITEQRKTTLFSGETYQTSETLTPVEQAIKEIEERTNGTA